MPTDENKILNSISDNGYDEYGHELDSLGGVSDEEMTKRFIEAVRIQEEIKKIKGLPVAKYDIERRESYIEYPDGSRKYAKES